MEPPAPDDTRVTADAIGNSLTFGTRRKHGGKHGALPSVAALGIALAIHVLAAVLVLRLRVHRVDADDRWRPTARASVEVEVEVEVNSPTTREPPPALAVSAAVPSSPETRPVMARLASKLVAPRQVTAAREAPPTPAEGPRAENTSPGPDQEAAPEAKRDGPPILGVTMTSVVSGEPAASVPVGNTISAELGSLGSLGKLGKLGSSAGPLAPAVGSPQGAQPFAPASEVDAATLPSVLNEVNSDDVYPAEARRLGIEGQVELSVDIDEMGKVVGVRVLRRAGHQFDEAAVGAMKKFVFSPARRAGGRPIPFRLQPYRFTFNVKN